MGHPSTEDTIDLIAELRPETPLEKKLLQQSVIIEGMLWGVPRYGHPEGEVYKHVKEVLANIDRLSISPQERQQLRLVALLHDTFKFQESKHRPRTWHHHHAVLAKRFAADFIDDPVTISIIQYHDEAYYIWRDANVYDAAERSSLRKQNLLAKLGDHIQLYYLFFKCDTLTGDKNPSPIRWVEENFPGISPIEL